MGPRLPLAAALLAGALVAIAGAQPFEPDVTNGEFHCMRGVSEASVKFVKKRLACVIKCTKNFWRGKVPESDCMPPSFGGTTLECMTRFRGPDQQFGATIGACGSSSCPECYENGDCSETGAGGTRPAELASFTDSLLVGLFCQLDGATRPVQTCERKTTKEFVKMFADVGYCADLCVSLARRGVVPYSECTQASSSVLASCIAGRIAARIARIDRACVEAVAGPDFCFGTEYPSGDTWANLTTIGFVPYFALTTYCDS